MSKTISIGGVKPTVLPNKGRSSYDLMFFPADLCCHYCNTAYIRKYEQYYPHTFQQWLDESILIKKIAPNDYLLVCSSCQTRWEVEQVCPVL